jgi:exodeoxyribonuclease-3
LVLISSQKLRIITWNCNGGKFSKKFPELEKLHPDVAVIQEIAQPEEQNNHCLWTYDTWVPKGVAICTFNEWTVTPITRDPAVPGIFFPVMINGPATSFNLIAVWTMSKSKYIESLKPALEVYKDFLLSGPSVILGDFNSNTIWDSEHKKFSHTMTVEKLQNEFGLVSAYHNHHNEGHGVERTPTFFEHRHKHEPYHIDYCFVPTSWQIKKVEIGAFDEWSKVSDHCPLIVDISLNPLERLIATDTVS